MLGANPNPNKSLYKALLVKDEVQVHRMCGVPNFQNNLYNIGWRMPEKTLLKNGYEWLSNVR